MCLNETNKICVSKTKQNCKKPLTVSDNTLKIKVLLGLTFFEILLVSVVICKQSIMNEMSLYNVFKTANAMTLMKPI